MLPVLGPVAFVTGIVGAISTGFAAVITFMATKITGKVLLVVAAVAVIAALTGGFFAAIEAIADGISAALPPEALLLSSSLMPRNLSVCVSAVISANILRWLYDRNLDIIRMIVNG